jgi:rRNA maturation endonuclease Nob1
MNFPRSARYTRVRKYVTKFFIDEKITTFPIDPFQIIKNNNWGLVTYSELAREHGAWIEDIVSAFQSEDGYTIYDGENYTIAYNDTIQNQGRIRFTLMHEIGHIYMGHLTDFDETILKRSTLTDRKYKILENEVNSFARNVLAPVLIVKELALSSTYDMVKYFGLSQAAATVRFKALAHDYSFAMWPFNEFQMELFKFFISSCLHSKRCLVCNHTFVIEEAGHCPICGYKSLIPSKGVGQMLYKGFLLDENSRATMCPKCDNEHLGYEGDFCIICGVDIINKCASTYQRSENGYDYLAPGCETLLDGDARFCHKCGNQSSFFQQRLLKSWEDERKQIEAQKEFDIIFG